jgi:hypothetical protein
MRIRRTITLVAACLCLLLPFAALAGHGYSEKSSGEENIYTVRWWTVDGGGGASQGAAYTLHGTIGQPDAGRMQGGSFSLAAGFWAWPEQQMLFYLPLVFK